MTAFQPQHTGLYFSAEHIQQALRRKERPPVKEAWALFDNLPPQDIFSGLILNGTRYRFAGDLEAGRVAATGLLAWDWRSVGTEQAASWDDLVATVILMHAFEMVRDHPAFNDTARHDWLARLAGAVAAMNDNALEDVDYVERIWLGLLNMVAGVVLDGEDAFQRGVETYRRAVREDITPDGYITQAVQGGGDTAFLRQLLVVKALVLMAEVGTLAGEDLWQYTVRGVSVTTAAVYLNYYYYFPDKWRWDDGKVPDVSGLLRQHGGYLEILNSRVHPKDIETILYDLRPFFDVSGGGLTTLTHGAAQRRGWFG